MKRQLTETLIPYQRPAWQHQGACNGVDPELFFPSRGGSTKQAIAVCDSCPVEATCLEYAVDNRIMEGVWGGLASRARRKIISDRAAAAVNVRLVS